jgi:hypothetical protein
MNGNSCVNFPEYDLKMSSTIDNALNIGQAPIDQNTT